MQNQKNDVHSLATITQNGMTTINPPIPMVNEIKNDVVDVIDVDDETKVENEKSMSNCEISH